MGWQWGGVMGGGGDRVNLLGAYFFPFRVDAILKREANTNLCKLM